MLLHGHWKATHNYGATLDFTRIDYHDGDWEDVVVPGHWQEHPAFEHYPEKMLFRKNFEHDGPVPGQRYFLRFAGVFYTCKVWLNGAYLGEHEGYFEPFEYDVTGILREGQNVVAVFVRCEREADLNNKTQVLGVFGNWDCIPPHIQPGGIWGDVLLDARPAVFLHSPAVDDFQIEPDEAVFRARVQLSGLGPDTAQGMRLAWTLSPANFEGQALEGEILLDAVQPDDPEASFEIAAPEPRLWWTWDRGEPNLYTLDFRLTDDHGNTVHQTSLRFGIRTVEMDDWILKLNGERLFCRGSNYAPGDVRLASMDRDRYARDIRLAREANMNMLRVHAHVERPEFYDLCDETGILVWQDFSLQWTYAQSVEHQAVKQIRAMALMLAHHPSIALWCCHNEPFTVMEAYTLQDLLADNKWKDLFRLGRSMWFRNWNKNVLDLRLREALQETDSDRPIVTHSGIPGLLREGTDSHLYFGWYVGTMRGLDMIAKVNRRALRFVTEYGAQAYPLPEHFRRMCDAQKVGDIDWDKLQNEHMLQKNLMDRFSPPMSEASIEEYVGRTQWYQARVTRYYNEMLRRFKYNPCGGAVHFLFNDCAPVVSWSVVDYWRGLKQGYYALRDSFRPLLPMAQMPKRWYPQGELVNVRLFVVNDLRHTLRGATLRAAFVNQDGEIQQEEQSTIEVPADDVLPCGRAKWDTANAPHGAYGLILEIHGPDIDHPVVNQYEFELR